MGRRKLTRILIEGGETLLDIKNGQEETPMDIVVRKEYNEIIEILKNPTKMRNRTDRNSKRNSKKEIDQANASKSSVNWSPYGCHYFPDPRTFPSPKLDTLPKEPLKNGEQYFLDLAGNIRKGPKGVGNTCYCGPFFKHIEDKINRNRRSLRKYVHKATERIDSKVRDLAMKTDDQIEQLARTIVSDRIRCEDNKACLENWLKRDSFQYTIKNKTHFDNGNTMSRCKSLDILDDDSILSNKLPVSRSIDTLDGSAVVVHRNPEESDEESIEEPIDSHVKWDGLLHNGEYFSVSERLEELLIKTNEILEIDKSQDSKIKSQEKASVSSVISISENSNSASLPTSLHLNNTACGEINLDNVIYALRKDRQRLRNIIAAEYNQENTQAEMYAPPNQQQMLNENIGFFQNDNFDVIRDVGSIKDIPSHQPSDCIPFQSVNQKSDWKSKLFSTTSSSKKSETASLSKKNKVQELVARIQGKFSSSNKSEQQQIPNNKTEKLEQITGVHDVTNNEQMLSRQIASTSYAVRTRKPLPFIPSGVEEVSLPNMHPVKVSNILHQNQIQHHELHHTIPMSVSVEREVSNDSGFSMRGGSHHPSPSLSGNCEYLSVNGLPHCSSMNSNNNISNNNISNNDYLHGSLV